MHASPGFCRLELLQQLLLLLIQHVTRSSSTLPGIHMLCNFINVSLGCIDLSTSKAGEDVDYAIVDWDNWQHFSKSEDYNAFISQAGISVDAQRRYAPLEGTFFFALKSDNWVDDITVNIDIEAVVETPLFETLMYLEPEKP